MPGSDDQGGEAFIDDEAGGAADRSMSGQCEGGATAERGTCPRATGQAAAAALGRRTPAAAARREEGALMGGEAWPR
jgi:hypothetical protein